VTPPIRKLVQDELKTLVNEKRIEALEIGIGRIGPLHHADKSVAKLFTRHAKRNDVGAIPVACLVVVKPPGLFEPVVKRRRRIACSMPIGRGDAPRPDLGITSKIGVVVVEILYPTPDIDTALLNAMHALISVPAFGRTF
jgi:hypothetical protein